MRSLVFVFAIGVCFFISDVAVVQSQEGTGSPELSALLVGVFDETLDARWEVIRDEDEQPTHVSVSAGGEVVSICDGSWPDSLTCEATEGVAPETVMLVTEALIFPALQTMRFDQVDLNVSPDSGDWSVTAVLGRGLFLAWPVLDGADSDTNTVQITFADVDLTDVYWLANRDISGTVDGSLVANLSDNWELSGQIESTLVFHNLTLPPENVDFLDVVTPTRLGYVSVRARFEQGQLDIDEIYSAGGDVELNIRGRIVFEEELAESYCRFSLVFAGSDDWLEANDLAAMNELGVLAEAYDSSIQGFRFEIHGDFSNLLWEPRGWVVE